MLWFLLYVTCLSIYLLSVSLSLSHSLTYTHTHTCTHPVLVNMHVPQVRVVYQLVRFNVDGRLAATLLAHVPVRINHTPELRTCGGKERRAVRYGWRRWLAMHYTVREREWERERERERWRSDRNRRRMTRVNETAKERERKKERKKEKREKGWQRWKGWACNDESKLSLSLSFSLFFSLSFYFNFIFYHSYKYS